MTKALLDYQVKSVSLVQLVLLASRVLLGQREWSVRKAQLVLQVKLERQAIMAQRAWLGKMDRKGRKELTSNMT